MVVVHRNQKDIGTTHSNNSTVDTLRGKEGRKEGDKEREWGREEGRMEGINPNNNNNNDDNSSSNSSSSTVASFGRWGEILISLDSNS